MKKKSFWRCFLESFGLCCLIPPLWCGYAMSIFSICKRDSFWWIIFLVVGFHLFCSFCWGMSEYYNSIWQHECSLKIPKKEIILPAKNKNVEETFQFLDI